MGAVVAIGAVILIVVLIAVVTRHFDKKRTLALQDTARTLGFTFTPADEQRLLDHFTGFELFSSGRGKRIRNIFSGVVDETRVLLFDYQFTTGSGKNSNTYHQTVACYDCRTLLLPRFALRPEHIFHRIGGVFGYQDIDLPQHPVFSKKYLLRGPDETAVRELFADGSLVAHFEANPGLSAEGTRQRLIVYRASRRLKPEQWREFFESSHGLFARFQSAAARTNPAGPAG